ncbi:uncharacterized protein LOC142766994 [Rhipicephalus microplus]|uniref:uncharacterized protein LOC142766994 n=1 Tax=Rhipicephalus microplus TaxID=6941 RepID=UPI003F6B7384
MKVDQRLYTECSADDSSNRRVPLPLLCGAGDVTWHYQERYKTSYAIDKIGAFLNTYDTKESLQFKICDAWRDHGTSRIAISAYSVNADFPHPIFKCPKDKWKPNGSRLHFVQVFRDFLRKESSGKSTKATFFDRCLQLK